MRKPISPDSGRSIRVAFVTLDNHVAAAVDDARTRLKKDIPGLSFTVHAATDWADDPDSLATCREAIRTGDIIIVSMIFVEEHVKAIADVLEERHLSCDAMDTAATGYLVVYHIEIGLLFLCLAVLGPLTGHRYSQSQESDVRFGLAEMPG